MTALHRLAATVRDRVRTTESAIRTTSPPMLLGRKLLKKVATSHEPVSLPMGPGAPCVSSSKRQRQALIRIMVP